jgi:hypothetical protein
MDEIKKIVDRLTSAYVGPWKLECIDNDNYQARIVTESGLRVAGYYLNKQDYSNLTHKGTAEFLANSVSDVKFLLDKVYEFSDTIDVLRDSIKIIAFENGHCKMCKSAIDSKHAPSCVVGKSLRK